MVQIVGVLNPQRIHDPERERELRGLTDPSTLDEPIHEERALQTRTRSATNRNCTMVESPSTVRSNPFIRSGSCG